MSAITPFGSWNQIKENTTCNSQSYNDVYHKKQIKTKLYRNKSWVETILAYHMELFSIMLEVDYSGNVLSNIYNHGYELNRRALKVFTNITLHNDVDNTVNPEYITFAVGYRYHYNYHSARKNYIPGKSYDIHGNWCECIDVLPNQVYVFESSRESFFHFSFHIPNSNLNKQYKFRGAFHLRVDHLARAATGPGTRTVPPPYRPLILDPRVYHRRHLRQFVLWDDLDQQMDMYFTTTDPSIHSDEITPFLLKHPGLVVSYTTPSGVTLRFVDDVLRPIYNMVVTNVLNPLTAVSTLVFQPPVAVAYDATAPSVVDCSGMILARQNPRPTRRQTIDGVARTLLFGGGGRRTRRLRPRGPIL